MSFGKTLAIVGVLLFALVAAFVLPLLGFYNTEATLRTAYEAKTDANKADFDNVWKTISQVAQVPAQYKSDFADVFGKIMDARYQQGDGDGTLMRWIQEQNPTFDATLYAKVQTVVESTRASWTTRQKELRDIKREHDQLLRTFPGVFFNVFLGRNELPVVLVTSTRTEESFTTGTDDQTQLF